MKILIRTADNAVIYAQQDLMLDTEAHGNGWRDANFNTGNAILADADLPMYWTGAVWSYAAGIWSVLDTLRYAAITTAALADLKTKLSKQIDDAVLAVYDRPMLLSKEYEAREKAAADYKAAGYTGTVPARLAGFATPAGMAPQAAADLVLSQAAQLRGALDSLGDLRMRKYEVNRATSELAIRTQHAAIMAQIAAIAAAL